MNENCFITNCDHGNCKVITLHKMVTIKLKRISTDKYETQSCNIVIRFPSVILNY